MFEHKQLLLFFPHFGQLDFRLSASDIFSSYNRLPSLLLLFAMWEERGDAEGRSKMLLAG